MAAAGWGLDLSLPPMYAALEVFGMAKADVDEQLLKELVKELQGTAGREPCHGCRLRQVWVTLRCARPTVCDRTAESCCASGCSSRVGVVISISGGSHRAR